MRISHSYFGDSTLAKPEDDAGLGEIIWRHLHFHTVANNEADETFAHFPGNVGEDLMAAGELHAEHGACEDG